MRGWSAAVKGLGIGDGEEGAFSGGRRDGAPVSMPS